MNPPTVSVIIPTYNRAHLIREALESVFSQTYRDYEVIVVDDGSTDNTREILASYRDRIHIVWQENQGISAARNRGILLARGKYLAFLDSDDRWLPEKLERQVSYLDQNSYMGLVSSHLWRYEIGKEKERERVPRSIGRSFGELVTGPNFIDTSTVVIRKRCIEVVGNFDESMPAAEDWELWVRIAKRFGIHCMEDILAEHRWHPANTTKDMTKVYEGYWKFYKKVLRLHRTLLPNIRYFKDRKAFFQYLLGTTYLKQKKMHKALYHIAGALKGEWSIGISFDQRHSLGSRIQYFLKPYAAFTVSIFGAMVSIVIPAWRSQ